MNSDADRVPAEEIPVRVAWRLAASRAQLPGQIRAIDIHPSRRRVSGTITQDGFRGVLVFLLASERVNVTPLLRPSRGGALAAEIARYIDAGESDRALHVWCRDPRCEDAFAMFCELLVERLGTEPVGATLARCYEEFRRLLSDDSEPAGNRIAGLVGELLLLRDAVHQSAGSIALWSGPRGERHDFRNGPVALEVKTTLRSESRATRVHITDIDQLEPPPDGLLFLHVVRLERVHGGDASIGSLVGEIGDALEEAHRAPFMDALSTAGILPPYDPATFSIMSRVSYRVDAGFPRLTPSRLALGQLDPGVSNVSYDLGLDAAEQFVVPTALALESLICGAAR